MKIVIVSSILGIGFGIAIHLIERKENENR